MRKAEWETTGNAVDSTGDHLVWSVKDRKSVLQPPIDQTVKEVLMTTCMEKGFRLLGLEVMSDPIHGFVSAPPRVSPAETARLLRGISARRGMQKHPERKRKRWGGHLWHPSYYVGAAGHVSAATIRRSMENQRTKG